MTDNADLKPITWYNDTRRLGDLIPWEQNPKQLTEKQGAALQVSLDKFGLAIPLLISPTNEIYDGHQRQVIMEHMTQFGANAVVDVRVSSRELTFDERRELVVRLRENQAGWDFEALANIYEPDELIEWGMEDWKLEELAGVMGEDEAPDDPGAQIDKAEELREKWQTELGQLWRIPSKTAKGEHRIVCGDCTDKAVVERVMQGEKATLGFADPPYNAGVDDWDNNFTWKHDWLIDLCDYVIVTPGISAVSDFFKITDMPYKWTLAAYISNGYARSAVGFGWWIFAPLFSRQSVFKQKPDAIEIVLVAGEAKGEHHRGQKPPRFMEWIVGLYGDGLVFDPFLGSGTTIVAAERLGRLGRGIELSPAYVAVALERLADMGLEPELMAE